MSTKWDRENRERANEIRRKSYQRRKTKENEASRKYYERNKENILARVKRNRAKRTAVSKIWAQANAEKIKAASARWRLSNPQKAKEGRKRRRARKKGADGAHTFIQINRLYELQNGCCAICHGKLEGVFHEDHIMPLCRGGSDWIENIQLTCPECNSMKQAKDPIVFMQERGFLL